MKVAVVGLDSADWTLLDRWQHHLPNIATIRQRGVSGRLRSCRPPVTIPAWKCYSTGKNPGRLGVFWWTYPDFSTRRLQVNLPGGIGGDLWDYIPNALVINTPGTFPPKTIDGIMIAGYPCLEEQPFVTPPWAMHQLQGYRIIPRTSPGDDGFPDEAMELIRSRFSTFWRYASRFEFGQVTIFQIDELHHFYGSDSIVLDAWRLIDEEIGRIMEFADNIVLVSDHGSGPLKYFVNVVPSLQEVDAFRLRRTPWRRLSGTVNRAVRATPPPVRAVGERLLPAKIVDASRIRLEPMTDWFHPPSEKYRIRIDWSSLVLPSSQGLVYRNPRPGRTKATMSSVAETIEEIPGIDRVWRKEEIYSGHRMRFAPELWAEAEPGVEIVAGFDEE
ncbi:MAG: alkaline phosphatase family protein, partial [Thermoplasmata archaeon]